MRHGSKFNDLTVGDLVCPREDHANLYRVMHFTRVIDGEIYVTLKREASNGEATRTFAQLTNSWRKL